MAVGRVFPAPFVSCRGRPICLPGRTHWRGHRVFGTRESLSYQTEYLPSEILSGGGRSLCLREKGRLHSAFALSPIEIRDWTAGLGCFFATMELDNGF